MSIKYKSSGKRSFGSRFVFLMLAMVLVIGCTIGGTLAWLTAKTSAVENTFVAGQIGSLSLTETDTDQNTDGAQHQYIVIPGVDITKDPMVTYTPETADGTVPVDAYVFVELTGIDQGKWTWNDSTNQYEITSGSDVVLSFKIDEYWTRLNKENVFYKEVSAREMVGTTEPVEGNTVVTGQSIIDSNKIEVSHLITEDDVVAVATAADELTFTAYAIQQADNGGKFTPAEAWTKVTSESTATTP